MTIKEAMMRALDSADDFPLGWNTELAEVFKKSGMELYERRQKLVWVLRIVSAYSDEPPKVIVCRSRAKAVELMEKDICETLAGENAPVAAGDQVGRMSEANEPRSGRKSPRPRFDPTDLVRLNGDEAKLGDEIVWSIVKTDLRD